MTIGARQDGDTPAEHRVYSREEKRKMFGLDCAHRLEWKNWKTGGEYTRSLLLKNVSTNTIKIKYKLPATKYFSLGFPSPIKLCAGMSHAIKVTFRPVKDEEHRDHIEFVCAEGSFIVPIVALIPQTKLEVDSSINFGFVPAMEVQNRSIHVRNVGDKPVSLSWRINEPFAIRPSSSPSAPGETLVFDISFCPTNASVFMATAVCELEDGTTHITKVSGIGKYPFMGLNPCHEDFGEVLVGQSLERVVALSNFSEVDANFTIVQEGDSDGVFAVTSNRKSLLPRETTPLYLTYTPRTPGTFSLESFIISTRCGRKTKLTLQGSGAGCVINLSTRELGFGDIPAGKTSSHVLYIENTSGLLVPFQFATDPLGVFSFDRTRGALPPRSTVHVTISFRPQEEANYWKRVVCLIQDTTPISVDLYGTCFSEKTRPPSLRYQHIQHHIQPLGETNKTRSATKTLTFSEPLDSSTNKPATEGIPSQSLARVVGDADSVNARVANYSNNSETGSCWEDFFSHHAKWGAVSIDIDEIDFGSCSRASLGEYKTVKVKNSYHEKVSVFIPVPLWEDPSGTEPPKQVFEVFPSQCDVKVGGEATFRIVFRPTRDACYYHSVLDIVAFVKSMRNFRLVREENIIPPWNISLQVSGNTFLHRAEDMSPKIQVSTDRVMFPPTHVGRPVHQTLMFVNSSDTPVSFALQGTSLKPHFQVKPTKGLIPPHSQQLIGLRFTAKETNTIQTKVMCIFNNAAMNGTEVLLKGVAYAPKLSLSVNGSLYMKPTCVGASSQRTIEMFNSSRVPVAFRWCIPERISSIFKVHPVSGRLGGKKACTVTWKFSPDRRRVFEDRVHCLMGDPLSQPSMSALEDCGNDPVKSLTQGQKHDPQTLSLALVGEGSNMAIVLDPTDVELGTITVGYPVRRSLCLMNQSGGVLRYKIGCVEGDTERTISKMSSCAMFKNQVSPSPPDVDIEISVDEPEGTVPARAFKNVQIVFRPLDRRTFNLTLKCGTSSILDIDRKPSAGSASIFGEAAENREDCELACTSVTGFATFPMVQVTDLHSAGWAKVYLWEMMNADDINHEARSVLSETEKRMEKLEIEGRATNQEVLKVLPPIALDFGVAAIGSPPTVVHFELTNPGDLPVTWELHSNEQPEIDVEQWVEPSRPMNDEEKLRDFIVEKKIFDIEPRSGELLGEARVKITLTYTPLKEGIHSLPILMKVKNGKKIRLQLEGKTVTNNTMKIALVPSTKTFVLEPVPIGHPAPPLQMYSMRNGGPASLIYDLDLSSLDELREQCYNFEVLKFRGRKTGEVLPGAVEPLLFTFHPLEPKVYTAEVNINLKDGTSEAITIVGRGFHPDEPQSPEPIPDENKRAGKFLGHSLLGTRTVLSGCLVSISDEVVWLGRIPIKGVGRRVIEVSSQSCYDLNFDWELGALEKASCALSGLLKVIPANGTLSPGETLLCRIDYEAGLETEAFEGDIYLNVFPSQAQHDDSGSVCSRGASTEEMIAVDPPRATQYELGRLLRDRLPVHASTTLSIRNRLTPIGKKHEHTITKMNETRAALCARPPLPPREQLVVTIRGNVATQQELNKSRDSWIMPSAPLPPPSGALEGNSSIPEAVQSIVKGMLTELMREEDVASQFDRLEYEIPTTFADLSLRTSSSADCAGEVPDVALQLATNGEEEKCDANNPSFQNFAEFVVHNAILGLLQESAGGGGLHRC